MRLLDVWIIALIPMTAIGFLMHPAVGATLVAIMLLFPVIATVVAQDRETARTLSEAAASQNGHTA